MRQNPHVRICGGPGSATTLVYPTPFWCRFTLGLASVRFSRSRENANLVAAQPAVVRLGSRHDVFDIGVPFRMKHLTRIGTEDAAEPLDDVVFDGLRICVLITAIRSAPMLCGDRQSAPLPSVGR